MHQWSFVREDSSQAWNELRMGLYLLDRPPVESACSIEEEANTCYIINLPIRSIVEVQQPFITFKPCCFIIIKKSINCSSSRDYYCCRVVIMNNNNLKIVSFSNYK